MLGTEKKLTYVAEFEGLRGVLALWVLGYHLLTIADVWNTLPGKVTGLFDGGNAVGVFVILSGFVITTLLATTREPYGRYIARRFARLWPTLMVCLALSLAAQGIGAMPHRGEPTWLHLLVHATMLHGLLPSWILPGSPGAILNPAWSISLEWQFYLVAPLALSSRRALFSRFVIAAVAAFLMFRVWAPMTASSMQGSLVLPNYAHLFLLGITSGLGFRYAEEGGLKVQSVLVFVSVAAAIMAFIFLPFVANAPVLIWAVLFPLIAYSRFCKRINFPVLCGFHAQFLGKISYPLYLCHEVWIWTVQAAIKRIDLDGWALVGANAVFVIPLSIATAWLLHKCIEKPAMLWAKKTF